MARQAADQVSNDTDTQATKPTSRNGLVYHHMTLRTRFCYLDRLGPEGPVHWLGNVKTVPG